MNTTGRQLTALRVRQWLSAWEAVPTDASNHRSPPPHHFYVFGMAANELKALCGVYPRDTSKGIARSQDLGIQRRHQPKRSLEIAEFLELGHPWAGMSEKQRRSPDLADLRKPGWLPTAILVNIVRPEDARPWGKPADGDFMSVDDESDGTARLTLPPGFSGEQWKPRGAPPLEVIDGQHRLWAFEYADTKGDYELPVVAFHGLDLSWQAYLFWTINIKPKRINASLAFDLYPMLRTEDWLEKAEGPAVYRETRAQELTEALWAYTGSPWHRLINMLGEGRRGVSQAAWIRSLTATFIKSFEGQGVQIGGLFGSRVGAHRLALPWSRLQQAAYLIHVWTSLRAAIEDVRPPWVAHLAETTDDKDPSTIPFKHPNSLINTDPGVRGILAIANDLSVLLSEQLDLTAWRLPELAVDSLEEGDLDQALRSLRATKAGAFVRDLTRSLASFDWRTSSAPGLERDEQMIRQVLRGSTGYREMRRLLLNHLREADEPVRSAALAAARTLKLDR